MAGRRCRVIYDDQTDTQPDDTSSETVKPQTRAEEAQPDVDEFIVEIFDAEGTTVYKDTYANLLNQNGGYRRQDGASDGQLQTGGPFGGTLLETRRLGPSGLFRGTRFCDRKNEDTGPRRDHRLHAEQHQGDAHVLERPRGPVHRRNDLHGLAGRNVDGLCQG